MAKWFCNELHFRVTLTQIPVDGYGVAGSLSLKINMTSKQIVVIITQSQRCEQFIRYECFVSVSLHMQYKYYGWLVSSDDEKMKYWDGAESSSNSCACGMTNSCVKYDKKRNCDKNDEIT